MRNSVHLQKFPDLTSIKVDDDIVNKMDEVREICNCVFSLRKEANIRVRMPLKKITIFGKHNLEKEYLDLIKQEVNTKEIETFNGNINDVATKEIVLNMKECGQLFASNLKNILQAQKEGNWEIEDNKLKIAGFEIDNTLYSVSYKTKNINNKILACSNFNLLVMIDTSTEHDLIVEGFARDLIRMVQQERKNIGLEISDKIYTNISTTNNIIDDILSNWKTYICEQTLSQNISIDNKIDEQKIIEIDDFKFSLKIKKV